MSKELNTHEIYLEIGKKKVFAGSIHWPGWCRYGRDEESAIEALFESGPRYARVLRSTDLSFKSPDDARALTVVERVEGNATTDFGAPDIHISSDYELIDAGEVKRLQTLLKSSWQAFDKAVEMATERRLRKGPRGGGRDLRGIIDHVMEAEVSYLYRLGWKVSYSDADAVERKIVQIRKASLDGLVAAAAGLLPERGPRGGRRYSPRFFVRRAAWHVIDHTWEIEDRIL